MFSRIKDVTHIYRIDVPMFPKPNRLLCKPRRLKLLLRSLRNMLRCLVLLSLASPP